MKKFLLKENLEDIIQLNSDVTKVYNELLKANVYDPALASFHMAAQHGYLSVCQIIIQLASDSGHLYCIRNCSIVEMIQAPLLKKIKLA